MSSNFDFLKEEWAFLIEDAKEAEKHALSAPITSAIYSRIVIEKTINWLYENEGSLEIPYQTSLNALMAERTFKEIIPNSIYLELHHIRKIGNQAAHGKRIPKQQSIASIKFVYRFIAWFYSCYSQDPHALGYFDESIIKDFSDKEVPFEKLEELQNKVEDINATSLREHKKLLEIEEENEKLKEKLKFISELKKRNTPVNIPPSQYTEQETRDLLIDADLREAGWNPTETNVREYEVVGMPKSVNPTGIGYVDYVLWGDNGLPLAVVEAKRTSINSEKGKHQAELYANCLEQMTGQRPVIFYTNGYENNIWDDTFYATRGVHGFYTKKELQLLINRRTARKDIRSIPINENITDRYYQKLAIKRVAEKFTADHKEGLKGASRGALLVMATGTGKTRTAISMVDVLFQAGWIKRVLFLADRNALVTQAKRNFDALLPNLSSIDLTKQPEDKNTRLVFSTYPTIMNKIDRVKNKEERFYGVGHFDLIIVDEVHRSVYQKYQAIFEYFDSLLIGLTATPKDDADHDTYRLFDEEFQVPTYDYDLNEAIRDKYLCPFVSRTIDLNFLKRGIKYKELSDVDKLKYEETFRDEAGNLPTEINPNAMNNWLYNNNTIDKVLHYLMTDGIKVEGGDKIGKTIIFARNHTHATLIEKRFNHQFPQLGSKFLRVIDNYEKYAQDLIDNFSLRKKLPQIATSVDMLDTGIDVEDIVNLVLFRPVYSKSKFWQMIGRGTRLSENLFGNNANKKEFIVFDFCGNFDFFNENKDGRETNTSETISSKTFKVAIFISMYIADNLMDNEDYVSAREELLNWCLGRVQALNKDNFAVKMVLREVEKYSQESEWYRLSHGDLNEVFEKIAPLVFISEKDESAKRFDLLVQNFKLSHLENIPRQEYYKKDIIGISKKLKKLTNINAVKAQLSLLNSLSAPNYWKEINIFKLETIREKLRDLIKYIPKESLVIYNTDLEDETLNIRVNDFDQSGYGKSKSYKEKFESYIFIHRSNTIINKIFNNIKLTSAEIKKLEDFLFSEKELSDKEDFEKTYGKEPLGKLVRSVIGMNETAAMQAFSYFINDTNLRSDQLHFIQTLVYHFAQNGIVELKELASSPYTDINDQGLFGIFNDDRQDQVINIIKGINRVVGVG